MRAGPRRCAAPPAGPELPCPPSGNGRARLDISCLLRYWEHDDPEHHAPAHYGVRSEDFKYIVYYNDGLGTPGSSERVLPTEYELFDLRRDPAELHNVVDDPDYAAVRLELEAELGRLQDKYADQPYQGPQTPRLHWST